MLNQPKYSRPNVVLRLSIKTVGNIFGVTLTMMPLSPKLDQLELLLGSESESESLLSLSQVQRN